MKTLFAALTVAASLAAAPALAQDKGPYLGGHIGQAKADGSCDDFDVPGVSCKEKDTSWKILGGYQVNKNFAAEVGYIDFGDLVRVSGPGGTARVEAHAFDAVGVGILPLADRFSVYGKLGLYHGTVDATVRTFTLNADASDDSTDLTFGLGAAFALTRQVSLRGEWQRYTDVGGSDTGKDDIDVISLGVLFHF